MLYNINTIKAKLLRWETLSAFEKAQTVIALADDSLNQVYDVSKVKDLYRIEFKNKEKVIAALLSFLIGGKFNKSETERKYWIRNGHDLFIHALTEMHKEKNYFALQLLPLCLYEPNRICEARKCYSKINKKSYIYCKNKYECKNLLNTQDISNIHFERVKMQKDNLDLRDLLFRIKFELNDIAVLETKDRIDDSEYPYKLAAYVQRLGKIQKYLECRVCNGLLYPDLSEDNPSSIYNLVYFTCPQIGHDKKIYINHCYRCKKIVDERECYHQVFEIFKQSNSKQWLCMKCGGADEIKSGTYCPKCMRKLTANEYKQGAVCCACGHRGELFGADPQRDKRKPVSI